MVGFALCVRAEKHLIALLENVKCTICSNILLSPFESTCHHVACARCFSSHNRCPICDNPVDPTLLHPNEPLSKRSAAVFQTIKAYETFSGRKVLATSSPEEVNMTQSDQEDSEDCFFKKDKKFSKKYEKKKRESLGSKLLSVSQNDTPLIFPGEVLDTTQGTIDSEIDKNPNAIDKVQDWLSISQLNVGATVYRGPVRNIYPERMCKDFFQRKTSNLGRFGNSSEVSTKNTLMPTRSSKRLSNISKEKNGSSPTKSSSTSSPTKNIPNKTKSENSSPTKSNKSVENSNISNDISKIRVSKRSKATVLQTNNSINDSNSRNKKACINAKLSPAKSPNSSNQSGVLETPKAVSGIDSDTSNNYSFKANDSELRNIFSKVLQKKKLDNMNNQTDAMIPPVDPGPSKNETHLNDNKEKNPWKNVRKMKKVLNKHPRSHLKKLDISVAERNIPALEQTNREIPRQSETPIHIDDVISQSIVKEKCITPEVIRRCPSIVSLTSSGCINPDSPDGGSKKVDKDYLACQAAIIASKQYEMYHHDSSVSNVNDSMNSSAEPPLTHLSPVPKDYAKDVKKIVKKLEGEMAVSNILKDFEIECPEEGESEYSTDMSIANSSIKEHADINTSRVKPECNLFDSLKSDILIQENYNHPSVRDIKQKKTTDNSPGVSFVYKGRLNGRNEVSKQRKVPFYYKSKCTSKDWYRIPQDGLNIELHRDNVLTSIFIRNQPFVNVINKTSDSLKITQMRDAQTSPIPFLSDEACSTNNSLPQSTSSIKPLNEQQSAVTYRMHPNLQRFTNCIVPSISTKLPEMFESKAPEILIHEHSVTRTPKKEQSCGKEYSDNCKKLSGTQGAPVLSGTVVQSEIPCTSINLEVSSPPLIVSEPIPDSLFNTTKKRKSPHVVCPISKKPKTFENIEFPVRDDINIVFTSQTQTSNKGNAVPFLKTDSDSEPMNYDAIMGTVMANIDRDLGLVNSRSGSRSTVNDFDCIKNTDDMEKTNVVDKNDKNSRNSETCNVVPNTDPCSFVPSQRKMIEDETDLDVVSMEMEPEVLCTNMLLQNVSDKKSEEFVHNTLIENDKTIENLMADSKPEVGETQILQKCVESVKEIPETSNHRDSSQVKDSENIFSTMFDKNTIGFSQDSHSSKPDGQIVSSLNLPQSIQQLRDEDSKYLQINNTLRHAERTVELSPHEQLLLTPSMKVGEYLCDVRASQDLCTPITLDDDSDSSMVEDTPQKVRKFTIVKKSIQESSIRTSDTKQSLEKFPVHPVGSNNQANLPSANLQKQNIKETDTPMCKFSDDIKVCSTPVGVCARRSLSYKDNLSAISEDEEIAGFISEKNNLMRQSTSHTATCMEKEFLEQAFESSIDKSGGRNSTIIECSREVPKTQITLHKNTSAADTNRLVLTNNETRKNICVACSCLNKVQIGRVKALVAKLGWKFSNEYVDEVTHLVVRVDENNRSQRSIKYVQSLASGKWIVSFNWVQQCILNNSLVHEGPFEVLDSSGELGPYMGRTRTGEMFKGFTFYCCPPFSVISHNVLTNILKDAGANIVDTIEEIEVKDPQKISILLAEPSSTEDDRFYDIVMHHKIVPINFEWVTECLGEGTLSNAGNCLLVPRSLLPPVQWPLNLTTDESMDVVEIN